MNYYELEILFKNMRNKSFNLAWWRFDHNSSTVNLSGRMSTAV